MSRKLNCIMLVDDNRDDNFFHERVIRKQGVSDAIVAIESAPEALHYLKSKNEFGHKHPDLIFLDINMPGMNGWEFIEEYKKLNRDFQSKTIIVMLTTSENPDDRTKAALQGVLTDFITKPLTGEMLDEILSRHFE